MLDWQPGAPWRGPIEADATRIFLGVGDGRADFAVDADGAEIAPDIDTEVVDVRPAACPLISRQPSCGRSTCVSLAAISSSDLTEFCTKWSESLHHSQGLWN